MDTKELRIEKAKTEAKIGNFIRDALHEFYEKTGESIEHVSVTLYSVSSIESGKDKYLVGDVRCDIDL